MLRVVVHGGAGHTIEHQDGCLKAAQAALEELQQGKDALTAAVQGIVTMESDGRFNAGRGANLGLDGRTKQMDASLMDTRGKLAAIAGIEHVEHPILVARWLADTPMRMVCGDGATRLAHAAGFPEFYEVTDQARQLIREVWDALCKGEGGDFPVEWHEVDFERLWNYKRRLQEVCPEYCHGTTGVVTLDAEGHFAVATSTGGSGPMPLGRLGDAPILGSGFYAGPLGAFAATGDGEYNIRTMLARSAYDFLEDGLPLRAALDKAVELVPKRVATGLIGVTKDEMAASSNRPMPQALLASG